jgi:hypothetical protein
MYIMQRACSVISQVVKYKFSSLLYMVSEHSAHANQISLMALSNSSSSSTVSTTSHFIPNFTQFISIKLDNNNYLMWQSQVLLVLCSNDLLGIVDGTDLCPPKVLTDEEGQSIVNP